MDGLGLLAELGSWLQTLGPWLDSLNLPESTGSFYFALASTGLVARSKKKKKKNKPHPGAGFRSPILVQENAGFHLGIARNLETTGMQAAHFIKQQYDTWLDRGWGGVETHFKSTHFTIAVGGGNTVKAQYRALLKAHSRDINWVEHVRFFFLEESSGERQWQSAHDALLECFIEPLAQILVAGSQADKVTEALCLAADADPRAVAASMAETMAFDFHVSEIREALRADDREGADKAALKEARRYTQLVKTHVGEDMAFHLIVSGIAKNGGIGAFAPYSPALKKKKPGCTILEQDNGSLRLALNRGVLTNAERISLIISGSLKLKALGRFEMEDSAPFEQTVGETPLRMFRENHAIAEKVYIFADNQALDFEEGVIKFRQHGKTIKVKAEVREGLDPDGTHMLLLHGFMGLYSFVNLLIRLPSAWKVSALHRGKLAKNMPEENIFPHYALCLRHAVMQNWSRKRPTPIGCHSMGGMVTDHLLLSALPEDHQGPLPEFEELTPQNQALIESLRSGGIVMLATFSPADVVHLLHNIRNLTGFLRDRSKLDYSGPENLYSHNIHGGLQFNMDYEQDMIDRPTLLDTLMKLPGTQATVNFVNLVLRYVLSKKSLQSLLSSKDVPYGLRLISERLLSKVSFYGLLKEVSAAVHDPYEYIDRHLKALEMIIKYDIPTLSMIHEDDFIVSANRHQQEHDYLLARRLEKEGVKREEQLSIPVRFVMLEREQEALPLDPLNPHLMLMSTYQEGDRIARELTAAMTRFVNDNVARASAQGKLNKKPATRKRRKTAE